MSLSERIAAYKEVHYFFGFLQNLHKLTACEITECASKVIEIYTDDLEEELIFELIQLKELINEFPISSGKDDEQQK